MAKYLPTCFSDVHPGNHDHICKSSPMMHCGNHSFLEVTWQIPEKNATLSFFVTFCRTVCFIYSWRFTLFNLLLLYPYICIKVISCDRNTLKQIADWFEYLYWANHFYLGAFIIFTDIFQFVDFCISVRIMRVSVRAWFDALKRYSHAFSVRLDRYAN